LQGYDLSPLSGGGGEEYKNKSAPFASVPLEVQEPQAKVSVAQRPRLGAAGKKATVALPFAFHFITDATFTRTPPPPPHKGGRDAKGALENKNFFLEDIPCTTFP
jgi:hypothetical protein